MPATDKAKATQIPKATVVNDPKAGGDPKVGVNPPLGHQYQLRSRSKSSPPPGLAPVPTSQPKASPKASPKFPELFEIHSPKAGGNPPGLQSCSSGVRGRVGEGGPPLR